MSANGRLASSELTTVQGAIQLARPAAVAWFALKRQYELTHPGDTLMIAQPLGGYRDFEMQKAIKAHPERYGVTVPGSMIAGPGSSPHGTGMCADIAGAINRGDRKTWLLDWGQAARFGWRRTIAGDENHYQYAGSATADSGVTPIEEDEMTPEQWTFLQAMNRKLDDLAPAVTFIKKYVDAINGKADGIQAGVGTLLTSPAGVIDHPGVKTAAQAGAAAALADLHIPTAEQDGIAARNAIVK